MFPLRKRKLGGYRFGQRTFYGTKHTGTDYEAYYATYYAPFNGTITTGYGPQGGYYLTLQRDGYNHKFIARHLSQFYVKSGHVIQGQPLAVTGNSGLFTTNAHLHQEIYVNGKLIDPETFNWENKHMQLVNDKGTVYLVTGNKDMRKIGLSDLESLGLFGDEPQVLMDTSSIPTYNTIVGGKTIIHN